MCVCACVCVCVCVCVGRGRRGGGVGGKGETRVFFPLYDSQPEFMNLHRNVVHKHVYTYYIYIHMYGLQQRSLKGGRTPEVLTPPLMPTPNCSYFLGKNNSYSVISNSVLLSGA